MKKNKITTALWLQETELHGRALSSIGHITYISSWNELLGYIKGESALNLKLLIVDSVLFSTPGVTVLELLVMLRTLLKFANTNNNVGIAVAINQHTTGKFIKEIQQEEALGIVPADDYFGDHELISALEALTAGKPHWPAAVIGKLKQLRHSNKNKGSEIKLTARQSQVLELVSNRGLSNKKIASVLGISESTVKIHVSAILREYGVRNRTQLALAASKNLRA